MKKGNVVEDTRRYSLYVHTTPSNKKYVGITNREPSARWRKDGKGYRNNPYFYNAIQKYGWDNIIHNVLADNLTEEEAIKAEMELIEKLQTTDREYGYNHSLGGEHPSNNMANVEEYRLKQAMATHELWKNPEFREKITNHCKKHKPPKNTKPSHARKAVLMYSLEGELLARYDSIHQAAQENSMHVMCVSKSCNHKTRFTHGVVFRFENESDSVPGKGESTKRAVIQYSLDGTELARFGSIKDALNTIGYGSPSTIIGACTGHTKTAFGYRWSYEEG